MSRLVWLIIFPLVLSACSVRGGLVKIDGKLGQGFAWLSEWPGQYRQRYMSAPPSPLDLLSTTTLAALAKELTAEEKERIEKWLVGQGLNRYGDAVKTLYAGGNPLFDESTGETKERFEYILFNHPELASFVRPSFQTATSEPAADPAN